MSLDTVRKEMTVYIMTPSQLRGHQCMRIGSQYVDLLLLAREWLVAGRHYQPRGPRVPVRPESPRAVRFSLHLRDMFQGLTDLVSKVNSPGCSRLFQAVQLMMHIADVSCTEPAKQLSFSSTWRSAVKTSPATPQLHQQKFLTQALKVAMVRWPVT
jgi:hypothetical protein